MRKHLPDGKEEWEPEGFPEFAAALISTLRPTDDQQRVVVLEELCLRGNQLRTDSLVSLAEIVRLAAGDLRDLDLSENELVVESESDVLAWEQFLSSLSRCFVLRRLDLSGNSLGVKGFEILAKMYEREAPLELPRHSVPTNDEDTVEDTSDEGLTINEGSRSTPLQRRASNARELAADAIAHKTPTKAALHSNKALRPGKR